MNVVVTLDGGPRKLFEDYESAINYLQELKERPKEPEEGEWIVSEDRIFQYRRGEFEYSSQVWKKWIPSYLDPVILWDKNGNYSLIGLYKETVTYQHSFALDNGDTGRNFDLVEPYSGELQQHLKDLKQLLESR